jgi:uncharacterized OB-fold protein
MSEKRTTCPDCGSGIHPIRLIDQVGKWPHPDHELEYAAGDSDRDFFSGKFPSKGKVLAKLCSECGRIVLFAEKQ